MLTGESLDIRSRVEGSTSAPMASTGDIVEDVEPTAQEVKPDAKCKYRLRSRDQNSVGTYAGQSAGYAR